MGQIYVYFGKIKALFTIIGITMDWWKCNRNKQNGNEKFTRKIYHHVTVAREMYVIVFSGVSFVIWSQMSAMCNSHFAELTSAVTTLPSHNRTIIVIYEIRRVILFVCSPRFVFVLWNYRWLLQNRTHQRKITTEKKVFWSYWERGRVHFVVFTHVYI